MLHVPLAEVGKGTTFGDYELVFNVKRMATVVCTSDVVVLWTLPKDVPTPH
jgi:CRP-like cAMP-binding protein